MASQTKRKKKTDCCGTPTAGKPSQISDERLAALAWALAHPARVRIVQLLIDRATCVCGEIVDELPLAQSTVSQHLKILKDSGLVQGEIDGPKVCYCIDSAVLKDFKAMVAKL